MSRKGILATMAIVTVGALGGCIQTEPAPAGPAAIAGAETMSGETARQPARHGETVSWGELKERFRD